MNFSEALDAIERRTRVRPSPTAINRILGDHRGPGIPREYSNHDIEKLVLALRLRELDAKQVYKFLERMPQTHMAGWMVRTGRRIFFSAEPPVVHLAHGLLALPIHIDCGCLEI